VPIIPYQTLKYMLPKSRLKIENNPELVRGNWIFDKPKQYNETNSSYRRPRMY